MISIRTYSMLGTSAPSEGNSGIIKYNGDLENFSHKRKIYRKHFGGNFLQKGNSSKHGVREES